jgi:serine/threonine protein kinase
MKKEARMERRLNVYIKNNYLLLMDSSFLLSEDFIEFYLGYTNILKKFSRCIYIPSEVIWEIDKIKRKKKNLTGHIKALEYVLELMKEQGVLKFISKASKNHVDNLFLSKITELRLRKDVVLFTKDKGLSEDVLALNKSNSTKYIKDIKVYSGQFKKMVEMVKEDYRINENRNKPCGEKNDIVIVEDKTPAFSGNQKINSYTFFQEGGEGRIYVEGSVLIKIYIREEIPRNLEEKLRLLKSRGSGIKSVVFPKEMVYNQKSEFIGYTMDKLEGTVTLCDYIRGVYTKRYSLTREDLVQICIDILEITEELHKKGIYIGDWNTKNILIDTRTKKPYLIDVDSYQIGEYSCPVGMREFTDPDFIKLIKGKNYSSYHRNEKNEIFALNTLLFQILMLGKKPYARKNNENMELVSYEFPYRFNCDPSLEPEGNWKYIWHNMTYKLKEAFWETFKSGERYKLDWWNYIMKGYLVELKRGNVSGDLIPNKLKEKTRETA